ncbi:MAG: ATP-binding domain-containing protein, partial [Armatimonadetes bacterium]|nr:ATP-binding domain-containing protein [Armatimonadota bacterium]
VFNGDIGIISEINLEDQEILVNFHAVELVKYEYHELDELVLAYACSIHKSQGSEYPAVIMPVSTAHYIMLQRNLIYTAITRAKKIVILIGTKKALNIAVKNEKVAKRYTKLSQRLKECSDMENFLDLK